MLTWEERQLPLDLGLDHERFCATPVTDFMQLLATST
jgi:hypothetical protein